jgi:predicted enzyme related to lactoylglutathione lyase
MKDKAKVKLPAPSQIALVVKDLEKTRGFYSATFGIGPWWLVEEDYPEIMVRGRKSAYKIRIATADLGGLDLKLVQPISGRSLYHEFRDEDREVKEGFHHMTFDLTREGKEQAITDLKGDGIEVIENGSSVIGTGANCILLNTDKIGGAIFKLRHRPTKAIPAAFRLEPMDVNHKVEVKLPAPSQIGSVVKDLDKTMKFYSSTFGIGPWRVTEMDYPEIMIRGQRSSYKTRIANADLEGGIELELIQPLSGRSLYSEFLNEGEEGFHHLTFDLTKEGMEQAIADLKKGGIEVIQGAMDASGTGDSFAYLNTDKIGGAIFKLRHRRT